MNYMQLSSKCELLSADDEYKLFEKFNKENCLKSAEKIILSNARFVLYVAQQYRNYKVEMEDLFQEGFIGLMRAVKTFDYTLGNRFVTYADMWIRSCIMKFITKNVSIVNLITSHAHRKLFFNLSKYRKENKTLKHKEILQIAKDLNVPVSDVIDMEIRFSSHDVSTNETAYEEDGMTYEDMIVCHRNIPQIESLEMEENKKKLNQSISKLSGREYEIFTRRLLTDEPEILEDMAKEYGVSSQRISQIEKKAYEKVKNNMLMS